jgi:RNA polymerase sigma-70 factor (ECF subfamily)
VSSEERDEMAERDWTAERFEDHRPRLRAIARRILGSEAEADDAVQEAWLRFSRSDTSGVDSLGAWLTTVVSRVCLNMLQARRTQAQPVAEPAPRDPGADAAESDPEYEALLADSVGHALMVVLDTLPPAERVALVLHDVFGLPFEEIGPIVGRTTPAARQLASRARARVRRRDAGAGSDPQRQAARVDAFLAAARKGDFEALLAVLDPDVVLRADAHAVELGAPPETRGRAPVAGFSRRARGARRALLDGAAAAVWTPEGRPRVVYAFSTGADGITAIDLVADPDRVRRMDLVILEPARW